MLPFLGPFLGPIQTEESLRFKMAHGLALDTDCAKLFIQKIFFRLDSRFWLLFLLRQARGVVRERFLIESLEKIEAYIQGLIPVQAVMQTEHAIRLGSFHKEPDWRAALVLDLIQISVMSRKSRQFHAGMAILEQLVGSGYVTWDDLVSRCQGMVPSNVHVG